MHKANIRGIVALMLLIGGPLIAAADYLPNVSDYRSFADSPFATQSYGYFHLENFEDGLTTPGLSSSGGIVGNPGAQTDSVDADDGNFDSFGTDGHSWYIGGVRSIEFSFSAATLGELPTDVGMVWTDVGITDTTFGVAAVSFEAFDASNSSLGLFGPVTLGDGLITGDAAEDTFFGVTNAGGISRVVMSIPTSGDWEVDHVQYGRVPEPTSFALLALAAGLVRRR